MSARAERRRAEKAAKKEARRKGPPESVAAWDEGRVGVKRTDYPRLLDLLKATERAKQAMMSADEIAEMDRLAVAEPGNPEAEARYKAFADRFRPSNAEIEAAYQAIQAEYEAKSRGSLAEDVKAITEITRTRLRAVLTPEEWAEMEAAWLASDQVDPEREDTAEGRRFSELLEIYMPRIAGESFDYDLHVEGLSIDQITRRYGNK
jgi:hypothetical protein